MVCLCARVRQCFAFSLIRGTFLLTGCQLWHRARRCVDLLVSLPAHLCWCISEVVSRCRDSLSLKENRFVGGWNVGETTMWTKVFCLLDKAEVVSEWWHFGKREAFTVGRQASQTGKTSLRIEDDSVTHMKTDRCGVDASFVFNTALWPWEFRNTFERHASDDVKHYVDVKVNL